MQVIEHIKAEHVLLSKMMQRAHGALAPLDRAVLNECLAFFRECGGLAHDRAEETVLFAALADWAPELAHGPLQAMQMQHDLARSYLRSATQASQAGPERRTQLLESVRSYLNAMQTHLHKEDEVLAQLAQVALPPSRDTELLHHMREVRRELIDDTLYERWVTIANNQARAGTMVVRKGAAPSATAPVTAPMPAPTRADVMDARTLGDKDDDAGDADTGSAMRAGGTLFEAGDHKNIWLHDFGRGLSIQSNQFLIVDGDEAMILDPGGPKVYPNVFEEMNRSLGGSALRYIFLSHQDPDIGTSLNAWLMDTKADALVSRLWVRFLPHFGIDKLLAERLKAIPDEGQWITLGTRELLLLPAHFLHSCGNFQVYDPTSKILFSGDLGAVVGVDEAVVSDFEAHRRHLEGFHRRYMSSSKALQAWARMVRTLDIEMIAPQHGAMFKGKAMVNSFIDWCDSLECGVDALEHLFQVPARPLR